MPTDSQSSNATTSEVSSSDQTSETTSTITSVSIPMEIRRATYTNPIYDFDFPDPSIVYDERTNQYFVFATGGQIISSTDLVTWQKHNYAFTTIPQWGTTNAGLWAPHVTRINDQYVMYYSLSTWGDPNPGIGVATAPRPNGPWLDRGELFRSLSIGVNNSIDPVVFVAETGKVFMIWGSMRGNYIVELTSDGLSLKDGDAVVASVTKQRIAGFDTSTDWHVGTYEGSYIQYRNGYYYLFLSTGTCCEGVSSTYRVVVARSQFAMGPYFDASGRSMLNANVGTLILDRNNAFAGPGHNAIITDAEGVTWMFYHAYKTATGNARVLLMDKILWDEDGWPYIEGGTPSNTPQQGMAYWYQP